MAVDVKVLNDLGLVVAEEAENASSREIANREQALSIVENLRSGENHLSTQMKLLDDPGDDATTSIEKRIEYLSSVDTLHAKYNALARDLKNLLPYSNPKLEKACYKRGNRIELRANVERIRLRELQEEELRRQEEATQQQRAKRQKRQRSEVALDGSLQAHPQDGSSTVVGGRVLRNRQPQQLEAPLDDREVSRLRGLGHAMDAYFTDEDGREVKCQITAVAFDVQFGNGHKLDGTAGPRQLRLVEKHNTQDDGTAVDDADVDDHEDDPLDYTEVGDAVEGPLWQPPQQQQGPDALHYALKLGLLEAEEALRRAGRRSKIDDFLVCLEAYVKALAVFNFSLAIQAEALGWTNTPPLLKVPRRSGNQRELWSTHQVLGGAIRKNATTSGQRLHNPADISERNGGSQKCPADAVIKMPELRMLVGLPPDLDDTAVAVSEETGRFSKTRQAHVCADVFHPFVAAAFAACAIASGMVPETPRLFSVGASIGGGDLGCIRGGFLPGVAVDRSPARLAVHEKLLPNFPTLVGDLDRPKTAHDHAMAILTRHDKKPPYAFLSTGLCTPFSTASTRNNDKLDRSLRPGANFSVAGIRDMLQREHKPSLVVVENAGGYAKTAKEAGDVCPTPYDNVVNILHGPRRQVRHPRAPVLRQRPRGRRDRPQARLPPRGSFGFPRKAHPPQTHLPRL